MKKRIVSILLATLMLLSAVPLGMVDTAWAAETEVVASGSCGLNVKWVLTSDGTLTISGKTRIDDYGIGGAPWYNLRQYIKKVAIQNGVQAIGDCAFSRCTVMTSVMIPDSVTSIGEYAFSGCSGLTSVTIPKGVTRIENSAFRDCASLTSVTIPRSVTSIGAYVFSGGNIYLNVDPDNSAYCSIDGALYSKDRTVLECAGKITGGRFIIPTQVTCIGDGAFMSCRNLTSVTIPDSVTSICRGAFSGCSNLASVTIPDSVTYLDAAVFVNCTALQSVKIPDGVDFIQPDTFNNCTALTSVTIPDSVTFIGQYAFSGCSGLTSVKIPNGVFGIREHAFHGCTSLTSVTIPSGLASINEWTFSNCVRLAKVTIPKSVTSIGVDAFSNCDSLTDVYYAGTAADWAKISISEGNEDLTSAALRCAPASLPAPTVTGGNDAQGRPTLKWNAVSGAAKYEVYRARSKDGDYTKYSTTTGTAYTNSSYLTSGATYYYKVRALDANGNAGPYSAVVSVTCRLKLTAPTVTGSTDSQGRPTLKWNAVTGAAKYEVYRARSKDGDYIKYSTVTGTSYTNISYIENGNTYYYKVRALDANGTAGAWSSIVSVTYRKPAAATVASGKCGDSAKWTLDAAGTLTISGSGKTWDFIDEDWNANAPWYDASLRLRIKKVVVEKGITYVGTRAFYDCSEMTSVSLPTTLETMGADVFMYCTGLTSVTIPDGVTFISGDFFLGCTSLKSVTLPDSLRDIGGCTFMYCTSLTSVRLPATLLSISWQMFKDCKSLTSLTIPRSVVNVMQDAFSGCTALKNVTYTGTAADWKALTIYSGNEALTRANVRCTGSTVLTAPTLTLSVSKKGQPTLKWNAVSGAAGYQIWCSYDSGDGTGPWYYWLTNLDKGTASFTDDRELEKGRTYTYKVRAVTSSGAVGSFSKEVTFTYNPAASLAAPTVTAGLDDQGYPALTWPAVPDAARYEVYRAASGVTLGDSLFQECENLTDVTLPADLTVIGDSMFENCTKLTHVTIPSGVTRIEREAFTMCGALEEIRLPEGVETIGVIAFSGCVAMTGAYLPRSLTTIESGAFSACRSLTDVYYGGTAAEWAAISVADRNDPLLNAALHCTGQSASRLDVPAMTLGEDCSDGKPTVWWPAVTGAERYEIWRAQAASDGSAPAASAYTLIVSADVTFHKDTTAEADTWYYYKVRAVSGSTYSDFSQAARRYCEAPPTMDTPEITSLELDDSGKPVLTWRTVEGAARYQVFRSEDNGFSYSPMGTVLPTGSDTITWTDTTAVSGTGYYYGVGCYDDNGHYSSFGGGEWWVTAR